MKKMLICGATGFIGRNLLDYYMKTGEYKLYATFNKTLPEKKYESVANWLYADLTIPEDVDFLFQGMDIVLQFAATTSGAKDIVSRPHLHVTNNAVMNSLLLREAYYNHVEHFIFPSCTVMYQPSDKPLKESDFNGSDEIHPTYFGVGNTKVYIEKMCEFFSRLGKTKHTVIRHSNIYGPYDKYDLEKSHVFGATITKVMKNTTGELNVWGDGKGGRDLLHVNDLIKFIDLSIKKQVSSYELFNVGRGEVVTIIDLIKKIIKHSGKDLKIVHDLSKPSIPTSLYLDCNKAKNLLGWESEIDIDTGIKMVLDWYKEEMI